MKHKIIAVVGPTSSGKSALGIWLAKKLRGEVISADSRQVYKRLNLGTGKVTKKEMAGIPHYLLSVANPKRQFSVDDFVRLASQKISSVYRSKKIPIVVGGTGLYVDMLLGRMSYPNVPPNNKLRAKLDKKSVAVLYAMLKKLDPRRAATIERGHKRRLIRAIEVARALGASPPPQPEQKYDVLWLGINPPQNVLRKNIAARLRARLKAGMVAEAKKLHTAGLSYKRMEALGLEYKYLAYYLQKKLTKDEMVAQLERAIAHYAKRQHRWFKRNKDIVWIKNKKEALKRAKQFLKH